jgi:ligand-binding sensor domain-containing protein
MSAYGVGLAKLQGDRWTYWLSRQPPARTDTTFRSPAFTYAMLLDKHSNKWFFTWAPIRFINGECVPDTGVIEILNDPNGINTVRRTLVGQVADTSRWSFAVGSTLDSLGGAWFGLSSPCSDQTDLNPLGLVYYRRDTSAGQNFNGGNSAINLPNNQVFALTTLANGQVWAGTSAGVCRFTPDTTTQEAPAGHIVPPPPNSPALLVRGLATWKRNVWVFAASGLYVYDIDGNYRFSFDTPAGPSLQAVRPMDVAGDGTLWLGTANGIRVFPPGGGSVDYTSANSPLADDDVRTIRIDRSTGVVWIATAGGLSRFDPGFVASAAQLPSLSIAAYPNPARLTALGIGIHLTGNGQRYEGAIYDLDGRRVIGYSVLGNGRVVWNGRDAHNQVVRPGIYFLRAESGGRSSVVRIVMLR